jgi:hypothetical protein
LELSHNSPNNASSHEQLAEAETVIPVLSDREQQPLLRVGVTQAGIQTSTGSNYCFFFIVMVGIL